jgi:hypothetical protein
VEDNVARTNPARPKTTDEEGAALAKIAEDVGRLIGTTERRAGEWLGRRQNLVERLTRVRNSATWLLSELESTGAAAANAVGTAIRRGRQPARKPRKAAAGRHKPVDVTTRKIRQASETKRSKQASGVTAHRPARKRVVARPSRKPARKG